MKDMRIWVEFDARRSYRAEVRLDEINQLDLSDADHGVIGALAHNNLARGERIPVPPGQQAPGLLLASLLLSIGAETGSTEIRILSAQVTCGGRGPNAGQARPPLPGRPLPDGTDGSELLCDECYQRLTGCLAECQDACALPLDHDGECGPVPHVGPARPLPRDADEQLQETFCSTCGPLEERGTHLSGCPKSASSTRQR